MLNIYISISFFECLRCITSSSTRNTINTLRPIVNSFLKRTTKKPAGIPAGFFAPSKTVRSVIEITLQNHIVLQGLKLQSHSVKLLSLLIIRR